MSNDVEARLAFESLVSDLFVSWQRTREAIGAVETSLPVQMSDAIRELIAARSDMEKTIRAFMLYAISR